MSDRLPCVKDRLRHVFLSKSHSDCQFEVRSKSSVQSFKAHKLVLSVSSAVFKAMLEEDTNEEQATSITIVDMEPEAFGAMLEYIYTDNVSLTSSSSYYELYHAANKYMVPGLKEVCVEFLKSNLQLKDVCKTYEFAKLVQESSLMSQCLNIIKSQTARVLSVENLKDVKLSTILTILDQNVLNIHSETVLFDAIMIYAHHNSEMSTDFTGLKEGLKKIRFLTMSPREFAEGPALSDLLTNAEKLAIFVNISSPITRVAMPSGFSMSKAYRRNGCASSIPRNLENGFLRISYKYSPCPPRQ